MWSMDTAVKEIAAKAHPAANGITLNTSPVADFTRSLIDNQYGSSFGVDLNLISTRTLVGTTINGHSTIRFNSAALDAGSFSGTVSVPESSTFWMFG